MRHYQKIKNHEELARMIMEEALRKVNNLGFTVMLKSNHRRGGVQTGTQIVKPELLRYFHPER